MAETVAIKQPIFSQNITNNLKTSSCDNLQNHILDVPHNLIKASSDNPINHEFQPPIPPRNHFTKRSNNHINIHPIIQDGRKLSNTHYWLLPDKQQICKDPESEKNCQYINYKENKTHNTFNVKTNAFNSNKSRIPKDLLNKLACGVASEDEVSLLGEFNREQQGCDNHIIAKNVDNVEREAEKKEGVVSMGEAGRMVERLMSQIEGTTLEECQTALSLRGWDELKAVEYLKIESLFRLGLASRERCKLVLYSNKWDLAKAASDLVDFSH